MLRAMRRVMELEWPFVQGSAQLEKAHREGVRYWRDHFGKIGLRELSARLRCGDLLGAAGTLPGLFWYGRGQLLILPWKYRHRIVRKIRARGRRTGPTGSSGGVGSSTPAD